MSGSLCGVWVDETGRVHTTVATAGGGRETRTAELRPFAWLNDTPPGANLHGITLDRLQGPGQYDRLVHADNLGLFETFMKEAYSSGCSFNHSNITSSRPGAKSCPNCPRVVAILSS